MLSVLTLLPLRAPGLIRHPLSLVCCRTSHLGVQEDLRVPKAPLLPLSKLECLHKSVVQVHTTIKTGHRFRREVEAWEGEGCHSVPPKCVPSNILDSRINMTFGTKGVLELRSLRKVTWGYFCVLN